MYILFGHDNVKKLNYLYLIVTTLPVYNYVSPLQNLMTSVIRSIDSKKLFIVSRKKK